MLHDDAIEAEYTLRRDRLSGGLWPHPRAEDDDRITIVVFVLYALINVAAAALGLLIWIV